MANQLVIYDWLVVWNMNFMTFHILGMSSSQLAHIFQRGRAQPPTRFKYSDGQILRTSFGNKS